MGKKFSPHLEIGHSLWEKLLNKSDLVIDATCGNGNDTLALSKLVPDGLVVAIDIQAQAIETTKRLLDENGVKNVLLKQISHVKIGEIDLSQLPKLIVYNLGYLPKGDKSITTKTESTLESVKLSLELIRADGAISLTCYPGHDEGEKETVALIAFCRTLDPEQWSVLQHRWLNRPYSPTLIWIARRTSSII